MEERNILWGELVGGLLIVGCSIALVISLWRTLEQIPYFPFLILAALTSVVLGAGLYTLSHWKLESTSRGLLIIGTLLVPLNFLVLAGLSRGQEGGVLEILTEFLSLVAFTGLMLRAGRVLVSPTFTYHTLKPHWLLAAAILGASGSQLLVPRVLEAGQADLRPLALLGLVPVAFHGLAGALVLRGLARRARVDGRQANTLFAFIGMSTFAVTVALGFTLYWSEHIRTGLQYLSVPVALAAIPVLVAGALVHRKLEGASEGPADAGAPAQEAPGGAATDEPVARGLPLAVARLVGTATALTAMVVLLAALALAWPAPAALALIGGLNGIALTAVALRYRLPAAHVPALVCLGAGYLAAYHVGAGNLTLSQAEDGQHLLALALSPESGSALIPLVLVFLAVSEWLVRTSRRLDGLFQATGSGVAALLSLALVTLAPGATPERAALAYGIFGTGAFLANLRWRRSLVSYAASLALFGSLVAVMLWRAPDLTGPQRLLVALLSHATLMLGAVLLLAWTRRDTTTDTPNDAFGIPLCHAALASSLLVVLPLPWAAAWEWMTPYALCTAWLAGLWLVMAWRERWPRLFTAFQIALSAAVVLGAAAWLEQQPWFQLADRNLYDPRSLHAFGLALAALNLLWLAARLGLRSNSRTQGLLEAGEPGVDRVILGGLVLVQFALGAWAIAPGVLTELLPAAADGVIPPYPALQSLALAPAAWTLLGLLAAGLIGALWDRRPGAALIGLALVAVTVPVLAAGMFRTEQAVVSALRWGLGLCFVTSALCLWLRNPLSRLAAEVGIRPCEVADIAGVLRRLLIALTAVPVLVLTVVVAWLGFAGEQLAGPLPGTVFEQMGWVASHVVPLVLVSVGLAGHGVYERSSGYIFAAGLVANISLMGGYALAVVTEGAALGDAEWVCILQLGAAGAAVWALGWLGLRWSMSSWRAEDQPFASPLLDLQVGLAGSLLGLVLVPAVWRLLVPVGGAWTTVTAYPPPHAWTVAAGDPLGWIGLALVIAAFSLHSWDKRAALSTEALGCMGLTVLALFACTVEWLFPGWGYRTLMLGWAGFSLAGALSLGTLVESRNRRWLTVSSGLAREVELLGLAGVLALVLGVVAAAAYQDQRWGAVVVSLVGVAAAVLALRRRREGWAFAAACSFVLAVSLGVWHEHSTEPLPGWVVSLLQTDLIAAGVVALTWLAARRHLYHEAPLRARSSPLLGVLVGLGLAGSIAPAGGVLIHLLLAPADPLPALLLQVGRPAGWVALLVPMAAALWYLGLVAPRNVVHVVGAGGLMLGVLAACSAAQITGQGGWLAHHVLSLAWTLLGLVILGVGWAGGSLSEIGPLFWPPERRARAANALATFFPAARSRRWVESMVVLVVALALRGAWEDPGRPYWSSGATLAVAVLLGAMAVWTRRPAYVYASGLMVNVVGFLAWTAWGPGTLATLLYTQVACLAAGSGLWSALEMALRRRLPPVDLRGGVLPFSHAAALAALQVLGLLVLGGLASDLTRSDLHLAGPLAWIALAVTTAALALFWWDGDARLQGMPMPALYVVGLLTVGLGLHSAALSPERLCWGAGLLLAGYVLFAEAAAWGATGWPRLRQWLQLHEPDAGGPAAWFLTSQGVVAGLSTGLSVWMSLDFDVLGDCLAGPLAAGLLLPGGLLMTRRVQGAWLRQTTLALCVLAVIEVSWALLDPTLPAPWLQRSVLMMAALALMSAVYHAGLPKILPPESPWTASTRRSAVVLTGLTLVALAVVLVQEFALYDPSTRHTPLVLPLVLLAAVVQAALLAGSLVLAVVPGRDPFGLAERGRTLYVYAAEGLLVLLLVHLRLNVPALFPGFLGRHWTIVVMVLAFAGVGLSEWFQRRGLRVLAEPLQRTGIFLPLLPLLAFLVRPLAELRAGLDGNIPGVQPLLRNLPGHYSQHALVWFLLGLLYTLVAVTRRSSTFALLAALAANFGLWVIFAHQEQTVFLLHPQLWLIPLALILLAAESLNRDRLTPQLSLGLRYLALLLIYLSSTADMFIAGLGNSVVLPVALAVLSILGVLAGIVLRVRAFLFLGVTFLFLVIFAQIWHAAVDRAQTWVWWASGIVLGAAVLALFALFEKRRNDVLKVIEDIKQWK
jgi:hypothetical protein